MKKVVNIFLSFLILQFIGCSSKNTLKITVENNSDLKKTQELVQLSLSEIQSLLGNVDVKMLSVYSGSLLLASQIVDSDYDGEKDMLIFQDSFSPNEIKNYEISLSEKPHSFESKVYVTFIEGREDVAWENDRIAFRMYGPPLAAEVDNGIDVWSKRVNSLIIDKWYEEEAKGISSYHKDTGEGADFYSVGKSLGCGGSALLVNDKLFQSGVYTNYKIIENGPIRLSFELEYKNFSVDGNEVSEKKTVSLDAGSNLNTIVTQYTDKPADAKFSSGLVIREGLTQTIDENNSIISLWGNTSKNEEDGEQGIAVVSSDNVTISEHEGTINHLIIENKGNENSFTYFTGAGWDKSKEFNSKSDWEKYLQNYKKKLESPVIVKFEK